MCVRDEGDLVGANYWDSGDPGAGAGVLSVYRFDELLFVEDDEQTAGPYKTFLEAADAVGLLGVNHATTRIWVESEYRTEARFRCSTNSPRMKHWRFFPTTRRAGNDGSRREHFTRSSARTPGDP